MMATITIDDKKLDFDKPMTILEAAKRLGVHIPTLCYNEHLVPYGGCRICLVEASAASMGGRTRLIPACTSPAEDGMSVVTDSDRVKEGRKFVAELLLARCPDSEEIMALAQSLGVTPSAPVDVVGQYLLQRGPERDQTKCILCSLCVRVCAEVPMRYALSLSKRGIERKVKSPFEKISETCIGCGSCAYVCPTKTITIEEAS